MNSMFEMQASAKLDCFGVVVAACQLLATLLSSNASAKNAALTAWKRESELVFTKCSAILYCNMIVFH